MSFNYPDATEIRTETHYLQVMALIETYLAKGSGQLTDIDVADLKRLSLLVEMYEDTHYPMPLIPS